MFNDSRIVLPKFSEQGSFASLMSLYESNYLRIQAFMPTAHKDNTIQQRVWQNDECSVVFKLSEKTKYTQLIEIEECLMSESNLGSQVLEQKFTVRVYSDAQVATVIYSVHPKHEYHVNGLAIDDKRIAKLWRQNIFFNKWLAYLAERDLPEYK